MYFWKSIKIASIVFEIGEVICFFLKKAVPMVLHRQQTNDANLRVLKVNKHFHSCSGGNFNIFPIYNVSNQNDSMLEEKEKLFIKILQPSLNAWNDTRQRTCCRGKSLLFGMLLFCLAIQYCMGRLLNMAFVCSFLLLQFFSQEQRCFMRSHNLFIEWFPLEGVSA